MKVLIDSRFRDTGTIDEYSYVLPHAIKKVREIRLLESTFPNSIYQIDQAWNGFAFTEDPDGTPDEQAIDITPGNYTGAQLATEIETQLNSDMTGNDYTVTYSSKTNKFTTTKGSGEWSYDTGLSEEMQKILGLPIEGSGTQSTNYEHPDQMDLSYPRYLYLDINTGSTNTNDVMTNDDAHSFVIKLGDDPYNLETTNSLADYLQVENNNHVDVKVLNIKIRLPSVTTSRTPNFNGIDHQILLELL